MKDFRLFGFGGPEWGNWEDNYLCEPHERGGASAYFDAWPECNAFCIRVWHIDPKLEINFLGEGFEIVETKQTHHPDKDLETGKDNSSYCTRYTFKFEESGSITVEIPSESYWGEENVIEWGKGKIKDFMGRVAHYERINRDHYKVREILTDYQRKTFAVDDRVIRLQKIAVKMNRFDIQHQLRLCSAMGDFKV